MFFKKSICVYPLYQTTTVFSLLSAIDLHLLKVGKSLRSQNVSPPNSLMFHYLSPLNLVGFLFRFQTFDCRCRGRREIDQVFRDDFFQQIWDLFKSNFSKIGTKIRKITQKVGPQNVCGRKP